jgi:hypothetical protein
MDFVFLISFFTFVETKESLMVLNMGLISFNLLETRKGNLFDIYKIFFETTLGSTQSINLGFLS